MIKRLVLLFSIVLFLATFPCNTKATMPQRESARGWLGVAIQDLTPELVRYFSLKKKSGALVAYVETNSPAEHAGIKIGDVIIEFNGKPVLNTRDLVNMVANTQIGQTVSVRVIRKKSKLFLTAKIQQFPNVWTDSPETSEESKEKIKPSEDKTIPDDLGEL